MGKYITAIYKLFSQHQTWQISNYLQHSNHRQYLWGLILYLTLLCLNMLFVEAGYWISTAVPQVITGQFMSTSTNLLCSRTHPLIPRLHATASSLRLHNVEQTHATCQRSMLTSMLIPFSSATKRYVTWSPPSKASIPAIITIYYEALNRDITARWLHAEYFSTRVTYGYPWSLRLMKLWQELIFWKKRCADYKCHGDSLSSVADVTLLPIDDAATLIANHHNPQYAWNNFKARRPLLNVCQHHAAQHRHSHLSEHAQISALKSSNTSVEAPIYSRQEQSNLPQTMATCC